MHACIPYRICTVVYIPPPRRRRAAAAPPPRYPQHGACTIELLQCVSYELLQCVSLMRASGRACMHASQEAGRSMIDLNCSRMNVKTDNLRTGALQHAPV